MHDRPDLTATPQSAADRLQPAPGAAVIAVPTFRRNDELVALLPRLLGQMHEVDRPTRLMVIDNDPAAAARTAVDPFGDSVQYVHEQHPGIAAARNRALAESADADLLIFIDDDETPEPGWLAALLTTYTDQRPGAVVGPVRSAFENESPPWVAAGAFFQRPRRPTGTEVALAATNNLLIDLATQRSLQLTFDERFGISGGSDTLFTRELIAAGHRIVWCDEALVIDHVPASRNTREWVMRRAYRAGNTWSRTSIALARSLPQQISTRGALAVQGTARVAGGSARYAWGVLTRNLRHEARGARTVARGRGMLAGIVNVVHYEYGRPATSSA